MNAPSVSVLMAVYNAEAFLPQAIESLKSQTIEDWELLAVDDASTDGSLAFLRQYAADDSRIHVFSQDTNQGQACARNVALKEARGQYICMLDADDWFSPDALQKAVERMDETDADCVLFTLIEQRAGEQQPYEVTMAPDTVIPGTEAFALSLDWRLHGLYLVRRELHMRYPYDTRRRLYSDDNTTRLHYLHSRSVAYCAGQYHYRRHAQSTTERLSALRFLYMQANYDMLQTMREEGVDQQWIDQYETIRWYNYLGQLRLYHLRGNELIKDERREIHSQMRQMYQTFHRSLPFCLFEFRQWLGSKVH